jgi:hypothetical protein
MTHLEALSVVAATGYGISAMAIMLATWVVHSARSNHHPAITGVPVLIFLVILYSLAFYQ